MNPSITQFVVNNWYLFFALGVVLALLLAGPITQLMHGIKSLNPSQAILLINRESGVVVDISEVNEYKAGHVPDSINVPYSQLSQQIQLLEKHKNKPLIIICRTGNRSVRAAATLRKSGFGNVYTLSGGVAAWQRENLPVERETAQGK